MENSVSVIGNWHGIQRVTVKVIIQNWIKTDPKELKNISIRRNL